MRFFGRLYGGVSNGKETYLFGFGSVLFGSMAIRVRFGSGSCLVCKVRVRVLFGSFKNEGSSSVRSVRVRF